MEMNQELIDMYERDYMELDEDRRPILPAIPLYFREDRKLVIPNAKILSSTYRNFSGEKSEMNRNGERYFNIAIEDENFAKYLQDSGWRVKIKIPKNTDYAPFYILKVKVNFNSVKPPIISTVTRRKITRLGEETCGCLDRAYIKEANVVITPYISKMGDGSISAYLKNLEVTIEEDCYDYLYEDVSEEKPF